MTHIKNILVIIAWWILCVPVWALGLILIPLAIYQRKPITEGLDNTIAQYPNWTFPAWAWAWNNRMDGIAGDKYWREKGEWNTPWKMYLWTAIRNPAFNFRIKFGGIDGVVKNIVMYGPYDRVDNYLRFQGWQILTTEVEGERRWQYKYAKAYPWKIRGKCWGLFVDIGADISAAHVGKVEHLTFTARINPFKGFIE